MATAEAVESLNCILVLFVRESYQREREMGLENMEVQVRRVSRQSLPVQMTILLVVGCGLALFI